MTGSSCASAFRSLFSQASLTNLSGFQEQIFFPPLFQLLGVEKIATDTFSRKKKDITFENQNLKRLGRKDDLNCQINQRVYKRNIIHQKEEENAHFS